MIIIHPRIFSIFAFTVFAICGVKLGVTVMLECEPSLEVPCNAKHSRDTESPSPTVPQSETGWNWPLLDLWIHWPLLQFLSVSTHFWTPVRGAIRTWEALDQEGHGCQHSASLFLGFISSSSAHLKWLERKKMSLWVNIPIFTKFSMFFMVYHGVQSYHFPVHVSSWRAKSLPESRADSGAPQDLHAAVESLLVVPEIVLLESWKASGDELVMKPRTIGL